MELFNCTGRTMTVLANHSDVIQEFSLILMANVLWARRTILWVLTRAHTNDISEDLYPQSGSVSHFQNQKRHSFLKYHLKYVVQTLLWNYILYLIL